MIVVYCDGGCQPTNPGGCATWGVAAFDDATWKVLHEAHGVLVAGGPLATNNQSEYAALIHALQWLHKTLPPLRVVISRTVANNTIEIRTDSKLVVEQVNQNWAVRSETLRPAYDAAMVLIRELWRTCNLYTQLVWVPRTENTVADALTNRAYLEWRAGQRGFGKKKV